MNKNLLPLQLRVLKHLCKEHLKHWQKRCGFFGTNEDTSLPSTKLILHNIVLCMNWRTMDPLKSMWKRLRCEIVCEEYVNYITTGDDFFAKRRDWLTEKQLKMEKDKFSTLCRQNRYRKVEREGADSNEVFISTNCPEESTNLSVEG